MADVEKPRAQLEEQQLSTHYDDRVPEITFGKRALAPLIVGPGVALLYLVGSTLKFDVMGRQHFERVHAGGRRVIFAFWHRCLFLSAWWYRNRGIVPMASANFDGQLGARISIHLGYGTAKGSSTRGGLRALAVMARKLEEGCDAAFTLDGPRGPRFVAKPGPVLLARRTGCPIICFHIYAERGRTFEKSWDQFQMPKPFSRAALVIAPPIYVPADTDRDGVERSVAEMQAALDRVRARAESWFTLSPAAQQEERARWNA